MSENETLWVLTWTTVILYFVMPQLHVSFNTYQLKGGKMHNIRAHRDRDPIGRKTKKVTGSRWVGMKKDRFD